MKELRRENNNWIIQNQGVGQMISAVPSSSVDDHPMDDVSHNGITPLALMVNMSGE